MLLAFGVHFGRSVLVLYQRRSPVVVLISGCSVCAVRAGYMCTPITIVMGSRRRAIKRTERVRASSNPPMTTHRQ